MTQALNNAFGQRQVSTIYNALNQYRVVMEVAPEYAQGPEALDRLYVIAQRPARAAVGVQPVRAHDGRRPRAATGGSSPRRASRFELKPGVSLSQAQAVDRRRGRAAGDAVGDSGPDAGQRGAVPDACRAASRWPIFGTLLVVYIVLGVLYESYMHPLTILSTLPSAGVGALLALQTLETEFSLIAMLGLFLLVGVVMKNAILMIDVALQLERETRPAAGGRDPRGVPAAAAADPDDDDGRDAGHDAADDRRRRGSELRKPLGIAIVGGLVFSQVLTLYTTPVVYLYLDRLRLWARAAPPAPRADGARLIPTLVSESQSLRRLCDPETLRPFRRSVPWLKGPATPGCLWSPSFSESFAPPLPLRASGPAFAVPTTTAARTAEAGSAPGRASRSCAGGHGWARDIPESPYPADAR